MGIIHFVFSFFIISLHIPDNEGREWMMVVVCEEGNNLKNQEKFDILIK